MKNKREPNALSHCNFFAKNRKGQFYLIATIIIVGLVIGLAVTFNYSTKDSSYEAEEIAKELSIESEKVIDFDTFYSTDTVEVNQFESFANEYSSYVGEDKEIYFILVEGTDKEAYRYVDGIKGNFTNNLDVVNNNIQFTLQEETYSFKLGEGKNFYFVVAQETGGERYVFSG